VEAADNVQLALPTVSPFVQAPASMGYAPLSYMRYVVNSTNPDGSTSQSFRVDLAGMAMRSPFNASGSSVAQLPPGFWPPRQLAFVSKSIDGTATTVGEEGAPLLPSRSYAD
jgi:hypothetical protein